MRYNLYLLAPAVVAAGLLARIPRERDAQVDEIAKLDAVVQARFRTLVPGVLGMSRIVMPSSLGRHFQPRVRSQRDFEPENDAERAVIARLEERKMQVGLWVFGRAVTDAAPSALNFRALKGPGAITKGTPRPAWYPGLPVGSAAPPADALPDWKAIYPVAQEAMRRFREGGAGFETRVDSWSIAVRPVAASDRKCVGCHGGEVERAVGGVIYAWR